MGRRDGSSRSPVLASSNSRAAPRNASENPVPPGDETRPSASRRMTATRSAPNSTRAWSERSRTTSATSSREARSVATRRRASERRRRLVACSAAPAPRTRTPSVRAIAVASRRPSSGPSSIAPAITSRPQGASPPGIATSSSSVPMPSAGRADGSPGRAWIGSWLSSARAKRLGPLGMLRGAAAGPSTSVARATRPPGRRSQIPTRAAPVATRIRRQASSSAGSRPVGNEATSARSASRSRPAVVSVRVDDWSRRAPRYGPPPGAPAGTGDSAAARNRWRSPRRYRRSPRSLIR